MYIQFTYFHCDFPSFAGIPLHGSCCTTRRLKLDKYTCTYGMSLFEFDRMHSNVVVKLYRTDFLLLFILTRL